MEKKYNIVLVIMAIMRNTNSIFGQNVPMEAPKHYRLIEKLLIEAGCKGEKYDEFNYKWIETGIGMLLHPGACIPTSYDNNIEPTNGKTIVYTTIEKQSIRRVDDQEKTLSIDLRITMRWIDPLINTNFSKEDERNGGIALSSTNMGYIWRPTLWLYKEKMTGNLLPKMRIENAIVLANSFVKQNELDFRTNGSQDTIIEFTIERSCTFYCNFEFSDYPFDLHFCKLRFGSEKRNGVLFRLFDPTKKYHVNSSSQTSHFVVTVAYADYEWIEDWINIGLDIHLVRLLKPFVMKYYFPCSAVVFIAQLSFIIPLSAIPGRVSLLVTLFLTLINVFIKEMVSK